MIRKLYQLGIAMILPMAGCNPCDLDELDLPMAEPGALVQPFDASAVPTPVQASGEPRFTEQPLFDAIPGRIGHHAPTLAAFEDGEVLAAWYSFSGEHELGGSPVARVIADGDEHYAYPSAIQTPNGLIHIAFSVSKASIRHVALNESWVCGGQAAREITPYFR